MRGSVDGKLIAAAMAAELESELAALRTSQSASDSKRDLAVPDEIWDGIDLD
jgi:hypothetical protein